MVYNPYPHQHYQRPHPGQLQPHSVPSRFPPATAPQNQSTGAASAFERVSNHEPARNQNVTGSSGPPPTYNDSGSINNRGPNASVLYHPLPPRPNPSQNHYVYPTRDSEARPYVMSAAPPTQPPPPPQMTPAVASSAQNTLPVPGRIRLTEKDYVALEHYLPRRDRYQIQSYLSTPGSVGRFNKNEVISILHYLSTVSGNSSPRMSKHALKHFVVGVLQSRLDFPFPTSNYAPPTPTALPPGPPPAPKAACTFNLINSIPDQCHAARSIFAQLKSQSPHFAKFELVAHVVLGKFSFVRNQNLVLDFRMDIDARTRRLIMGQDCDRKASEYRWWVSAPALDEERKKRRKVLMYMSGDQQNGMPAYLYSQHHLQADHVCMVNGVNAWSTYNGRPLTESWGDVTPAFRGALALTPQTNEELVNVNVKLQKIRQGYWQNSMSSGTVCIMCVDEVDIDGVLVAMYEQKLKQRGCKLSILETLESGVPVWARDWWRASPFAHTVPDDTTPLDACISASSHSGLLSRYVEKYLDVIKQEADTKKPDLKRSAIGSDDLELGDEVVQFRDPVSLGRMQYPAKGRGCSHKACFDAKIFITLNETTPKWRCPVCRGNVRMDDLVLDDRVTLLLDKYAHLDQCIVHPDGTDSAPQDENDKKTRSASPSDHDATRCENEDSDRTEGEDEGAEHNSARRKRRKVVDVIDLDDDDLEATVVAVTPKKVDATGTMIGSSRRVIPVYEID